MDFGELVGCGESHQCKKLSSGYRAEALLQIHFSLGEKYRRNQFCYEWGRNEEDMREYLNVYEVI